MCDFNHFWCCSKRMLLLPKGRNSVFTYSEAIVSKFGALQLFPVFPSFLFFFCFLHMEVPRLGVQSATAAGLCRRHGNAGSLTHGVRPGIEPATSWFLAGFVSAVPWQELRPVFSYSEFWMHLIAPAFISTQMTWNVFFMIVSQSWKDQFRILSSLNNNSYLSRNNFPKIVQPSPPQPWPVFWSGAVSDPVIECDHKQAS